MTSNADRESAKEALDNIKMRRSQVIAEIDMPWWYWWGLGVAWIGLGAVTDLHNPWLTSAGTLIFGAAHASVAQWVIGGRRRTNQISVRQELAGRYTPLLILSSLMGLAGLTILIAVVAIINHIGHPVTLASVVVAAIIILGGPRLMALIRRRAHRTLSQL